MDSQLKHFLNKIKLIESSGGKDKQHEVISHGIHEGQSAHGSYGLMPNTIQELVNRKKLDGSLDSEYKKIQNEDADYVKAVLHGNPELEQRLAEQLAEKVLKDTQNNEELAAYKWNMGHNLPTHKITPEVLNESQYINKFRKLKYE